MEPTSRSRGDQPPGDVEALVLTAEARASRWARHGRDCINEIRRALPDWPGGRVLKAYLIAASFLGFARGLDERQNPRK